MEGLMTYPRPRSSSRLSESFQSRLNEYAFAATAAGVGVLALAQPAEGRIVLTKVHQVIGTNGVYNIDLNHDGIIDFLVMESGSIIFNGTRASNYLRVDPGLGNGVVGKIGKHNRHFAAALKQGSSISPARHFLDGNGFAKSMVGTWVSDLGFGPIGPWYNVTNRYLGLKFTINGKTHYGWARLPVQLPGNFLIDATVTGFAYETIPDKPIQAGQTGDGQMSLGQLALGAARGR